MRGKNPNLIHDKITYIRYDSLELLGDRAIYRVGRTNLDSWERATELPRWSSVLRNSPEDQLIGHNPSSGFI